MTNLNVGLLGTGSAAALRRESLARLGVRVAWAGETMAGAPSLDVLFVATPLAERHAAVQASVQQGVAVFAEWPPAPSLREAQALVAMTAEAGVPVGVARTLRFHPALAPLALPARLVVLRRTTPEGTSLLAGHALADVADLCAFLAQGPALTRLDAHAVRDAMRAPRALAFNLRFQNGAYAQAALLAGEALGLHFHATTATDTLAADLYDPADLDTARDAETRAFLDAVAAGRPAPVTPLDALQSLRLAERLWARLR